MRRCSFFVRTSCYRIETREEERAEPQDARLSDSECKETNNQSNKRTKRKRERKTNKRKTKTNKNQRRNQPQPQHLLPPYLCSSPPTPLPISLKLLSLPFLSNLLTLSSSSSPKLLTLSKLLTNSSTFGFGLLTLDERGLILMGLGIARL